MVLANRKVKRLQLRTREGSPEWLVSLHDNAGSMLSTCVQGKSQSDRLSDSLRGDGASVAAVAAAILWTGPGW